MEEYFRKIRIDVNECLIDINECRSDVNECLIDINECLADINEGLADINECLADINERLADINERLADINECLADINEVFLNQLLLKKYDDIKDLPLESRDKKKVKGTDVLAALDKNAKDIIKDLKRSVKGYLAENTILKDGFLTALTAPKVAKKSNAAKIILLDEEGNPFTENAKAYDIKSKAKKLRAFKANSNGIITIDSHKVGKFSFKIVIKGKEDVKVTITFKKGETVEVTVTIS